MSLQLSVYGFKCCCLSLAFFLIRGILGASFVSQPSILSVYVGERIDFNCIIANKSSDVQIEWWYLNQNLQLSLDNILLTDDTTHYSLVNSLMQNGQYESQLQITDVQLLDSGYYKCRIASDNSVLEQTNTLFVSDGVTVPVTGTTASYDSYHANFTDCCIEEGIDPKCLPICGPGSYELSTTADCMPYTLALIKCGSNQRNHIPCCVKRRVPDFCLEICQNQLLILSSSQLSTCAAYVQSVVDCFQEGYYLLPPPPTLVMGELVSETSVRLSWQSPSPPGNERVHFRVFYQETSAQAYRSTPLTEGLSELVGKLHSNTQYQFFVISINRFGSSQPSYSVEVTTHQDTGVTPSPSNFSLLACCEEQQVDPLCRSFLCAGELTPTDSGVDLLPCYSNIDKVFQCISGMRNNTECCIRHGLSPKCYPLCDGQLSQVTFEQLDCFQEMGIISSCFQEGHQNIPGHPANVVVDSVTSTSADVRWSLPSIGSDKVLHYTVRYRKRGDPLYSAIYVDGLNLTLFNLLPSTLYEVTVASVGELGTSLPSPAVVFQTYWVPGIQPATSSPILPPFSSTLSPPENLYGCCLSLNVSRECLRFCSFSLLLLNSSDSLSLLSCLPYANQFLQCATDGMNHTGCCQSRRIKTSCLGYCSGVTQEDLYDVNCLLDVPTMLTCFKENSLVLPSMPLELSVLNKTAFTIITRWLPPLRNPGQVRSYIVNYRQDNATVTWSKVATSAVSFILQNLLPDTTYAITIVAQGEQGASLPTPVLRARTLPVNVIKKVNITQNLTDCCTSLNVSEFCLPVCAGSGEIALHECGSDLSKIIECAADGQDHTPCCRRMNIPTHCLDFCGGNPKVDSFSSLVCVSFIEQVFTCFHENFEKLPYPPEHFRYTEIGSTYIDFRWSEPAQPTTDILYNIYYTSRSTNTTLSIKGLYSPYRLPNLRPLNQYDVYMVAVNAYGSSRPSATLTITTASDSSHRLRVEQEPEGYVAIGSKVILRCVSSEAASLVWLRQDERFESSILQLDATTEDDSGRYTCVIQGHNAESVDIILKIQYAPFVEPRFQSLEVDSGQDQVAHLECRFYGFPDEVQWQRVNGEPIETSHAKGSRYTTATYVIEDESIIVAQLSVNQVTQQDFDWYTCEGSNMYASVNGYVMLTAPGVTLQPAFPSYLPRIESVTACCLEKQVSASCTSACVFDIDITAIQLRRLQCVPELPKMVECSADGRNHSKCCVDQNVPAHCLSFCSGLVPTPVDVTCLAHISKIIDCMETGHANLPSRPLNVTVTIDAAVVVTWHPPKSNPSLVQFYEVSYTPAITQGIVFSQTTATSDVLSMVLKNVTSFMRYGITVTAQNHHGSSVPSDQVFFTTQEPFPSPPTNVSAQVIDPVSIQVTWGHPEVNWQSVALYSIYFLAIDNGNWSKLTVGQSVFQSMLKDLKSQTVYRIYVTSVSSHFESSPSREIRIQTTDSDYQSKNHRALALGVGLFFLFFISFVVVIGVSCWCHRHRSRYKESVSFENPSYTSLGDGQIRLPVSQDRDGSMHSSDYKAGSGSNDSSTEAVYIENVVLKEANCQSNVGYSTLPTADGSSKTSEHSVANGSPVDFGTC